MAAPPHYPPCVGPPTPSPLSLRPAPVAPQPLNTALPHVVAKLARQTVPDINVDAMSEFSPRLHST